MLRENTWRRHYGNHTRPDERPNRELERQEAYQAMIEDLIRGGAMQVGGPIWIIGRAIVELGWWAAEGVATLNGITVQPEERGKGHASAALDRILAAADFHGVEIELSVDRFGNPGLTKAQLRRWYGRRGFESMAQNRDRMRRAPRLPAS